MMKIRNEKQIYIFFIWKVSINLIILFPWYEINSKSISYQEDAINIFLNIGSKYNSI